MKTLAEGLPAVGAQGQRRLLLLQAGRLHNGNQLAGDEREGDKHGRQHDAGHGENDFEVVRIEPLAEEALQPEQHDEHQAGDDGRDRERKVNHRNQDGFARELELGDGPRCCQAKQNVHRHCDDRY